MKKILLLVSSLAVIPMITSCTDYGVYGHSGGFGPSVVGTQGFVGGGFAPLQVGFVATSFDRWAYDPFRRHYYDRSVGRYFDPRLRSYCSVVPRRYTAAVYPSGYRRGGRLSCPTYLPRNNAVVGRGGHYGRGHSRGPVGVSSNRGRYSPVVHGSSRGSSSIRNVGRSGSVYQNRGSVSNRGGSYRGGSPSSTVRRSSYPQSSRGSVNQRSSSNSPRLQTISSNQPRVRSTPSRSSSVSRSQPTRSAPAVRSQPVVRSQPAVRRQPSRPTPTVRSSGSSRSTSSSSRAVNKARQRTR